METEYDGLQQLCVGKTDGTLMDVCDGWLLDFPQLLNWVKNEKLPFQKIMQMAIWCGVGVGIGSATSFVGCSLRAQFFGWEGWHWCFSHCESTASIQASGKWSMHKRWAWL